MRRSIAAAAVIVAVLTSGCSPDPKPDNGFRQPADMEAEYWEATKHLVLPANKTWPPVIHLSPEPDQQGIPRGHTYQPGYGANTAEWEWFCLWQREWLSQRGKDQAKESAALAMVMKFKETKNYLVWTDDGGRDFLDGVLAKAQVGDPSLIVQNVENNCRKDV